MTIQMIDFKSARVIVVWSICAVLLAQKCNAAVTCTDSNGSVRSFRSAQIYFTENPPAYQTLENEPAILFPDVSPLFQEDGQGFNISGFIVICPTTNPPLKFARLAQKKGAIAIVFGSESADVPGRSTFNSDIGDGSDVKIPIIELGLRDFTEVKAQFVEGQPVLNVTISYEETNPWIEFFDCYNIPVLYALGIGIPAAVSIALSIFKLYKLERGQKGCRWSIGQSCLTCHLIANTLRLVYVIIDPLGSRRLVLFQVLTLLATLPFPFLLAASLLLCFYWLESMSTAMVFPFLKRLRIPFFVLCGVLISIELVTYFFRIFGNTPQLITYFVSSAVYYVVAIGIAILYIVISVKLLARLSNVTVRNRKLKKMTSLILGSVCCYILGIVCTLLLPFPTIAGTEVGWTVVNFIVYEALVGVSICQILVFTPRGVKSSNTSRPA